MPTRRNKTLGELKMLDDEGVIDILLRSTKSIDKNRIGDIISGRSKERSNGTFLFMVNLDRTGLHELYNRVQKMINNYGQT